MTKNFNEDVVFNAQTRFSQLPITASSEFAAGDTTPNVSNLELIKGSGSVVTITNFIGGTDGQLLRIIGDGTTTIAHNTFIKTSTGANKLLSADKVFAFSYFEGTMLWYELN